MNKILRAIGLSITFIGLAVIYLYGSFLSAPPDWLIFAYSIVSHIIGLMLFIGFFYWIYRGIRKLVRR
jgi:hypothetical protein